MREKNVTTGPPFSVVGAWLSITPALGVASRIHSLPQAGRPISPPNKKLVHEYGVNHFARRLVYPARSAVFRPSFQTGSRRMHRHIALAAIALVLAPAHSAAAQGGGFGTAGTVPFALQGRVYYIPENSEQLPDFSRLRPVGTISTTMLNIQPQSFTAGFPGVTDRFEWFAIDYNGRIMLPQAGTYTFRLTSDDGSRLFIDGREVIDNDGVHGVQAVDGEVQLAAGIHEVRVQY